MSLLITGATIIDGASETPIEGKSICIEGERIKAIGTHDELGSSVGRTRIIDARGKYVIPGLMNANVHLLIDTRLENLVRHEGRYEDLIIEAAQISLKNGVTTVFDTNGPRRPLIAARDRINSDQVVGSRIFCGGWIIGFDGPYSSDFHAKTVDVASSDLVTRINSLCVENVGPDLMWMTPDQVAREVRAYISKGVDFIKYASNDHMDARLLFSGRVQRLFVEEAHRAGITAQAHTTAVEGLRVAIEAGCDLIQHINVTGPVPIPESTLKLLTERQTGAVVFPFTRRRLELIMNKDLWARRAFANIDVNCRSLIRSGASILLASDGGLRAAEVATDPRLRNSWIAPGEDNLNDLGEGHFFWFKAMEEKGMAPMEMLRAATRNIAVAYSKDKDLGTIEPGKVADLIVLDENPLLAAENYRSIQMIFKAGVLINRDILPMNPILTLPTRPLPEEANSYDRYALNRLPAYY